MLSVIDRKLAQLGLTRADLKANTNEGKAVRRYGVRPGQEHSRIKTLPRRRWEESPDLEQFIEAMTAWLKTPQGTQRLRPHQAVGLQELHDYGRFVADFPVGEGKTLVTFLAPVVLEAQRPLLLVPANLVEKTFKEFRKLAEHWNGRRDIEILSYEKLSREKQADFLERFQPDLILCDEVYSLKSTRSGRTKRVKRYMKAHPETKFLPLSGTFWKNSVHDYAHISEWAMKDLSPVPHTQGAAFMELQEWANAVDVKPKEQRMAAGALAEFCSTPPVTVDDVRAALAKRRNETPGWVRVSSRGVDASLVLQGIKFDEYTSDIDKKFADLRENWQTPTGIVFAEPQKLWQYLRQCSMEFEYFLDPQPPEEWLLCRKAAGAFVRDILSTNYRNRHFDTEMQVWLACARGEIIHHGLYDRWKAVRPLYDPAKHRHTHWFGDSVLKRCLAWLESEKGVLFTPFVAVGQKLQEMSGLPYFAEGGLDSKFGSIEDYKGGPCIASLESNKRGRNLQDRWSRALVVGGVGSGPDAEQLIGRMHRTGQEADAVQYDFLYGCIETLEQLYKAKEEAKFSNDPNHKLILGDWNIDELEDVEEPGSARWCKK